MSILTSIAKQLLILDDKLHAAQAARANTKADVIRFKAADKHVDRSRDARLRIKRAQEEGAALVSMREHALREAKREQIQLVECAQAHLDAVNAQFEEDKSKALSKDSAAVQHVVRSQKAREAVQVL